MGEPVTGWDILLVGDFPDDDLNECSSDGSKPQVESSVESGSGVMTKMIVMTLGAWRAMQREIEYDAQKMVHLKFKRYKNIL